MRCTKCGFISFDHYTACTRCKTDLSELQRTLQGSSIKVVSPLFLAPALQEALHEGYEEEETQNIAIAEVQEPEPVGLDAVAAELESQAMLDGIMASAASKAAQEEEVPSIDLGQFEVETPQARLDVEPEAELPELDLGFALEVESAATEEEPIKADAGEELAATSPVFELPSLAEETPSGGGALALEGLTAAKSPEFELSLSEEPEVEAGELTLEEAAAHEEPPSGLEDLSLGLEEINLADLVPGALSEETIAGEQGGIDFNIGILDLEAKSPATEVKEAGGSDIFDLASIVEELGEESQPDNSSGFVNLADLYRGSESETEAPATPSREAPSTGEAKGISFKLEMEGSKEEPPAPSEEKNNVAALDDLDLLPDLDLKLEDDK